MAPRTDPDVPLACKDHPGVPALAQCVHCHRPLCDECYRFRLGDRPACARCGYEASTRPQRRVALGAAFVCFAWGGGFWLERRYGLWNTSPVLLVVAAALAPVIAYFIGASAGRDAGPALERREPGEDAPSDEAFQGRGSPYRAYARRAILAVSPRLSGKVTALVVGASLAATAVLLPAELKLPRWIEAELVLAAWWVIVAGTLVVLLYRGFRLRDDLVLFMLWDRPARSEPRGKARSKGAGFGGMSGWGNGCSGLDGCSGADGEGCAAALAVAAAFAVAMAAAWVFVELAVPMAFFLTYWLFMRAIGRVANDRHECEGDLGKAIGWGAMWATIYVLPLAALTWVFHEVHR
jgi:hypothetical protein